MSRVAIVTGGTRGIGRAICEALAADGMTVVANYAGNEEKARAFTDETGITAYKWDVGDHQACLDGCRKVASEAGPVDVLVNNAGVTRDATLLKMSFEDWYDVMRINLGGCFNMAKGCFPGMKERGWGRIVNMASVAGTLGGFGQASYSTTKAGLLGLTRTLAMEGARHGITCNAIVPGVIGTEAFNMANAAMNERIVARTALKRAGEPQEIANTIAFLCSDLASYITGIELNVSGGVELFVF
jgi:acetoacetyl-CoA reductase